MEQGNAYAMKVPWGAEIAFLKWKLTRGNRVNTNVICFQKMKPAARHFAAILFLLFAGCDPQYDFLPVNDAGDLIDKADYNIDGANISCPGLSTLIGSRTLVQAFEVDNQTNVPVVLHTATLVLDTSTVAGEMPASGDLQWRSIPPRTTGQILVYFDLLDVGGNAKDALGATIKYNCDFEIDGKTEKLEWSLLRTDRVPQAK